MSIVAIALIFILINWSKRVWADLQSEDFGGPFERAGYVIIHGAAALALLMQILKIESDIYH